jgi:hypothetical protein
MMADASQNLIAAPTSSIFVALFPQRVQHARISRQRIRERRAQPRRRKRASGWSRESLGTKQSKPISAFATRLNALQARYGNVAVINDH